MSLGDTIQPENSIPSGRREILVLAVLLGITAAAFAGVTALVHRFRSWQGALVAHTYARGQQALAAGQPARAIEEFRSTLHFNPDDRAARISLAQALMTENRLDEAEAYFRTVWERQPQDATVNLQLARLAARRGLMPDALRYYHNAIYGIWDSNPVDNRIAARLELVNFLLQQNAPTQAQAELIAMEPGLTPDAELYTKVAGLFMRVPDYRNAFSEYAQALKIKHNNPAAAAGAGEAAFNLGRYRTAVLYLDAAMAKVPNDAQSRAMLDTSRLVLDIDPFLRHLSGLDRRDRILKAYRTAVDRLSACAKTQPPASAAAATPAANNAAPAQCLPALLTRARQLKPAMTPGSLMKNPELPSAAMDFVFDVEEQTREVCGEPNGMDEALLLIGRNREGVER